MNQDILKQNLERADFIVHFFDTAGQAADFIVNQLHGKTIGFGGSKTLEAMGLYDRLSQDNQVFWHWKDPEDISRAHTAQIYLSSVNAISETGALINIDGTGNRIAAYSSPKEAVYFVAGVNKIAVDFYKALWRARNIAAPLNARRLERKTPCVMKELKCYDCHSPERICRELSVLWRKPNAVKECHVVLINELLGF